MHCPHTISICTAAHKSLQCREIQISLKKSWKRRESNLVKREARTLPLSYADPPKNLLILIHYLALKYQFKKIGLNTI